MFGQPQPNTPFGQQPSGFGQQQPGGFGSPAPAPASGLFGTPAPAPGGFGAPPPPTGFAAAPGPGTTSFGQPAQQQPGGLFGSTPATTPAYAPAPAFGAAPAPGGGGLFGTAPSTTPAFGSPAAAPSGSIFGQAPAVGQPSPFGSTGTGFGTTAQAPTGFGAPAPSTGFGGTTTTGFGGTGTSTFGAPAPSTTGLFATAPSTTFGGAATSTPAFPAPAAPSTGLFGAPAPSATPPSTGFGFGGAATPAGQPAVAGAGGTRVVPFAITEKQDGTTNIRLHSITAMPQYQDKSYEELRFEDYKQGNRGTPTSTAAAAPTTFGAFGGTPPAPAPSTSLFSAPTAAAPGGFAGFGAAPTPAPGTTTTGLFGAPTAPAPAPFGQPAPAPGTSLFGAPAPAPTTGFGTFGAPTPAPGTTTTTGLFGAPTTPAPAPFGQPAPAPGTSLFGAPAPAPTTGFGAFGSTTPAPAPGTSLFGAPSAPAQAPFGQPPSGGLFSPQPAPAPGFGFAQAPAAPTAFGTPTAAPLFGAAPAQTTPAPFVGTPGMAQPSPMMLATPNVQIIPTPYNQVVEQQLRALNETQQATSRMQAWTGTPPGSVTTPTSVPSPEDSFMAWPGNGVTAARMSYASPVVSVPSPRSLLRPRGFPKSAPAKTTTALAARPSPMVGAGIGSATSPEEYKRSQVLQLVIKEGSLPKPKNRLRNLGVTTSPSVTGAEEAAGRSSLPVETVTSPPTDDGEATTPASSAAADKTLQLPVASTGSPREPLAAATREELEPSPAQKSYDRAIGAESTPASTVTRTTPTTTSAEKPPSAMVPKLSKAGYELSPSLEELSAMSEADLAAVANFAVSRRGVGKVEWEGSVDVRGVDVDSVVAIEHKSVSVYDKAEEEGWKPPQGTKLNRPARITCYNIFPSQDKGGANADAAVKDKFARTVKKATQKMGAELVSYDPQTGEWKIRVSHFSRYCLDVDEDEDEDMADAAAASAQLPVPASQTPPGKPKSILRRKPTPFRHAQIQLSDMDDSDNMDEDYPVVSDAEVQEMEADRAVGVIEKFIDKPEKIFEPSSAYDVISDFEEEVRSDEGSENDFFVSALPPTDADYEQAYTSDSISSRVASKLNVKGANNDYGLRMGRSFRAGWLPDGSLLRVGSVSSSGSPLLIRCQPELISEGTEDQSLPLLQAYRQNAQKVEVLDNKCPLYSLPRSVENMGTAAENDALRKTTEQFGSACTNDDGSMAFSLFSKLIPTHGKSSSFDALIEHNGEWSEDSMKARQIAAVSSWIRELCAVVTDREIRDAKLRSDTPAAVFAALSAGDLERATVLATEAGNTSLALALSIGLSGGKDVLEELSTLSDSGDDSKIDPEVLRVLKAIAGDGDFEDKLFVSKKVPSLGWQRSLALRLLREPETDLATVVERYDADVVVGFAPFPSPGYEPSVKNTESLHYGLLRLFANPKTTSLTQTVDPKGFTASPCDFSVSFYAASVIAAMGVSTSSDLEIERLLIGYEAQLISAGLWEWAVFVALCCIGELSSETKNWKTMRAKDAILRHFNAGGLEEERRRVFLETQVGVPSEWFEEALAQRAVLSGDIPSYTKHLLAYDPERAVLALEMLHLPKFFFMNKAETDNLMGLIEAVSGSQDSMASAIHGFFILKERMTALAGSSREDIDAALPDLWDICTRIEQTFEAYSTTGPVQAGTLGIAPPTGSNVVPLSSMISHTLELLEVLKLHLRALEAHDQA